MEDEKTIAQLHQQWGLFNKQELTLTDQEIRIKMQRVTSIVNAYCPLEIIDPNESELKIYPNITRLMIPPFAFGVILNTLIATFTVFSHRFVPSYTAICLLVLSTILIVCILVHFLGANYFLFFHNRFSQETVLIMPARVPSEKEVQAFVKQLRDTCKKRYEEASMEQALPSLAEELKRLDSLRKKGIITVEEFTARKKDVLKSLFEEM
jgi:hypothetical protein